jgi:hypothetical protein
VHVSLDGGVLRLMVRCKRRRRGTWSAGVASGLVGNGREDAGLEMLGLGEWLAASGAGLRRPLERRMGEELGGHVPRKSHIPST